jgi:hypothetical protein
MIVYNLVKNFPEFNRSHVSLSSSQQPTASRRYERYDPFHALTFFILKTNLNIFLSSPYMTICESFLIVTFLLLILI